MIGTNFGALMQIHLERVVGPKKLAGGLGLGGGGGGGRGVRNSNVRKSTCEHTHMHIHLQRVVGQLRRFALAFIHSHSGATGVFAMLLWKFVAEATSCLQKTLQTT